MREEVVIIEGGRKGSGVKFSEIIRRYDLFLALVKRDISVHYKQTFIGVAWVILQPLLTMLVMTLIVGRFRQLSGEQFPYPLILFGGLVPWLAFSKAWTNGSYSITNNQVLITKVYFPRVILPAAAVAGGIVDILINTIVLIGLTLWFYKTLCWSVLLLPIFGVFVLLNAFAISLWFSGLSVCYRDFQFALSYLVQIGQFVGPVYYPLSAIPEKWHLIYSLNPVVSVIEAFRWAVIPEYPFPSFAVLGASFFTLFLVGISGWFYFCSIERRIADTI